MLELGTEVIRVVISVVLCLGNYSFRACVMKEGEIGSSTDFWFSLKLGLIRLGPYLWDLDRLRVL